jgi:TfoX/Sxy family transcriptional regulator of competence genes
MSRDLLLEDRMQAQFASYNMHFETKNMFGGLCFMVDDKMCIGTYKKGIMARVDPDEMEELIKRDGAEPMIHNGRIMKGYLWLNADAYDMDEDLEFWINKCIEFNPKAKSSKRKKKT